MSKIVKTISLKKAAIYSKKRIESVLLNPKNYIGTDNLLQNKKGKINASYTPEKGSVCRFDKGDILISNIRPYLKKIWYATETGGSSADVLTLVVNENYNSKFVYYSLFRDEFFDYMMTGSKGTKMPRGDKNQVMDFLISDFEFQNQQKITSVLSTLDAKIELNNNINTELEAVAKSLYNYWFVQFDFPNENGKPYKSSSGEMVWSEELKRKIPKGWEVEMINKKVQIGSGFPFDSDNYCDNGEYKIITIKNVQDGSLDTSTIDKIDFIPEKINDFCILKVGDVLMSLTGNVGRMCFVDQENLLLNQRVGKLIGEKDFVIFTYLFFQRPENRARLDKIAGGSSQSNLSPIDAVKDFFAIPPKNILDNFSKVITPIFDQMVKNKQENQKLAELRDWILPMLMNGQVVVK